MKRSLFIAIVVLLMAALFVSCNADKAVEDRLVEVTVADGFARSLSADGAFDTTTATVAELEWYYTAVKTSGYFKEGEHTSLTPVKDGTGLAGATLGNANGKMSTGGWKFSFYGYIAGTTPAADPKTNAVYYQEDLRKVITGNIALDISLTRGDGGQKDPVAVFENGQLFWIDTLGGFTGNMILKISKGDEALVQYETTVSEGKATFAQIDDITLDAGANNILKFEVISRYTDDGVTFEEKLGESALTIAAEAGMKYTITSDNLGIDFVAEEPIVVTIGAIEVPVVTSNEVETSTTPGMVSKVEATNTPAAGTDAKTTVEFPIDLEGKQVRVETSSAEVASAKAFSVSTDSAVVGSISLAVSDGTTTFENGKATVTTYIGKNLTGVEVHYSGTDAADIEQSDVSYDPDTGYVTFATPHFSEFYVTAKGEAKIGSKVYNTFVEAVADAQSGATINLLKDANGAGIFLGTADAKTITIDLGNFTYTCSGPAVGSTGTATQALHLEKGNTVTIKNGTITSTATSGVKMLVQNYCNLTLEDVILDGANIGNGQYTLSNNCGVVNIIGATSIYAPTNGKAFDVCAYSIYSAGVTVNVSTTGTISGIVEIDANKPYPLVLNISSGTFEGSFRATANTTDEEMRSIINITGGTFNGIEPVAFVNNAVYGSLMDAIDSVADDTPATIVLLRDVTDGTGLATDSTNADSHKKNLTIDFNGKTYTMKDPAVGSTGTKTQAMHWAAGSTIVLKNGTFAVQADAVNVKMGMQNYANLTVEDMVLDLRAVPAGCYGENEFDGAYAIYNGLEIPIFNNNKGAKLSLKNTTVKVGSDVTYAVYTEDELRLDNCILNAKVALSSGGTPKAYVTSGTYDFASYFAGYSVQEVEGYQTIVASN